MNPCENCIFKAPLGYTKDCLSYNNIEQCPLHDDSDAAIEWLRKEAADGRWDIKILQGVTTVL
uniref:Uncharacterized protein n=1 Tax=viral metagenome TaxID=1070528 RepID=A0A6M3KHT0_9ZZZZ